MDTRFIFEQVRKMRPSSFSEEERHRYQAEKMMLRQFMLMKQQGQVPDHLSVRDMKTWLLRGRSFLKDFQEIIERTGLNYLFMTELAWTAARHFCVSQMEDELLEQLDKEEQLSQLFSRKVTLEGLQMLVSVVHPGAEEDVQTSLRSLHSKLLKIFGGIQITSGPLSAGDAKPAELLELEQSAVPLVPVVVDTALRFFLEGPEQENKSEGASVEIGKLLSNSADPCLSKFVCTHKVLQLKVCTAAAQLMVNAIYKRFDQCSKSFQLIDYDESNFSARAAVISAIQDMDHERQTAATSQAHLQLCTSEELEQGPLEKKEASPRFSLDEEMATMPNVVNDKTFLVKQDTNVTVSLDDELEELQQEEGKDSEKKEFLARDSAVQDMDNKGQTVTSSQGHIELSTSEELEDRLLEEREASLDVAATEELKEKLLGKREASPGVFEDEEVVTKQNDVTKDTSLVRLETNVIVYMDDELEVLQQEEVEASETQKSLVQDCDIEKKNGVKAFFCHLWKMMACCSRVSIED